MTDTVALLGLGLMGGSLARALREAAGHCRVVAWTPDGADPRHALRDGAIDEIAPNAGDAVRHARIVVLAAPVGASVALLHSIANSVREDVAITDLCSVKAPLLAAAADAGLADRFVGAHPMCGSHEGGWASGRADLYRGATVHIVPSPAEGVTGRIEALWRAVGARPRRTTAEEHDARMARASHLPQLVASALGAALGGAGVDREELGPGGRDMTRLAASPTVLWTDILRHNRRHVLAAWAELRAELDAATHALERVDDGALEDVLARGRRWTGDAP